MQCTPWLYTAIATESNKSPLSIAELRRGVELISMKIEWLKSRLFVMHAASESKSTMDRRSFVVYCIDDLVEI
jgi:hypothetical protein